MMGHNHKEKVYKEPAANQDQIDSIKEKLKTETDGDVKYFMGEAVKSKTQKELDFWHGKIDSANYFKKRKAAIAKLDATAKRNLEAYLRMQGTEASVIVKRVVGNACVLGLKKGIKEPSYYTLVSRKAGETGETCHGRAFADQWVIQDLQLDTVYEFAVVSEDDQSAKGMKGVWTQVAIGNIKLEVINQAEADKVKAEYDANEKKLKDEAQKRLEAAQKRFEDNQKEIAEQNRLAKIAAEKAEKEWAEKKAAHEKAVSELPLLAPRAVNHTVIGNLLKITFLRGTKKPDFYQFMLNGSVLGFYPDNRHSGRKPDGHKYARDITLVEGKNIIKIYGVSKHGDSPVTTIEYNHTPRRAVEMTREEKIMNAMENFNGRRTRSGKPYVRDLRKVCPLNPKISWKERNECWKKHKK